MKAVYGIFVSLEIIKKLWRILPIGEQPYVRNFVKKLYKFLFNSRQRLYSFSYHQTPCIKFLFQLAKIIKKLEITSELSYVGSAKNDCLN